jgi:hypothetical protein
MSDEEQEFSRAKADWLRRQAIQAPRGRYLQPTVGQRMRRMSQPEQHEVHQILRAFTLRNAVRRILYTHFHGLQRLPRATSLQRLQAHAQEQQSNEQVRGDFNEQRTPFELHVTNSEDKTRARIFLPPSARDSTQA